VDCGAACSFFSFSSARLGLGEVGLGEEGAGAGEELESVGDAGDFLEISLDDGFAEAGGEGSVVEGEVFAVAALDADGRGAAPIGEGRGGQRILRVGSG
jgi:hypothetical protein